MKKHAFFLCFFLITAMSSIAQYSFKKTFRGPYSDYASDVIETNDGGLIIAGNISDSTPTSQNWKACLMKVDSAGSIVWVKKYGGANDNSFNKIISTRDGGYLAIGGRGFQLFLVKTDVNGDSLWTRVYNNIGIYSGIQTSDGGYFLAGWFTSIFPNPTDAIALKIDSVGNVIWNKLLGNADIDFFTDCINTSDGGFVVCGGIDSTNVWYFRNVLLAKYDSIGTLLWVRIYMNYDNGEANGIVSTYDSGFAIIRNTSPLEIVKFDNNGNYLWDQNIGMPTTRYPNGKDLYETFDHGFITTGLANLSGESDLFLIKTDSIGIPEWTKVYISNEDDEGETVIQTIDSGFAVVGYTSSYNSAGDRDMYLIKTDKNGSAFCNEIADILPYRSIGYIDVYTGMNSYQGNIVMQNGHEQITTDIIDSLICRVMITHEEYLNVERASLQIYPNPFLDQVNISGSIAKGKIRIFTITGQLLLEKNISNTQEIINTENFENGIYILNYLNNETSISFKLIK